jgi:hypothetical protein
VRGWKVRFRKQDEPGITARLIRSPRGALLIEHGAHRITRVREITLGGEEPRRSEAIGQRLLGAAPIGRDAALLTESALAFFDPVSFLVSAQFEVDRYARDLCVSPGGTRCYAGAEDHTQGVERFMRVEGFTQVVERTRGVVGRLAGVPAPRLALSQREPGSAGEVELWVHPPEGRLRLVRFEVDGRPEVLRTIEAPGLADFSRFLESGEHVFALGSERPLDALPFPGGPVERALARLGLDESGVERQAAVAQTRIQDLLGTDGDGSLVALDVPGKTHVQLLDPVTLRARASRAFPKNGAYELTTLIGPRAVLSLRRWEKLDRVFVVDWGEEEQPLELRIADAKTTPEA